MPRTHSTCRTRTAAAVAVVTIACGLQGVAPALASPSPAGAVQAAASPAHAPIGKPIPLRFGEFLCETPTRLMPVLRTTRSDRGAVKALQYALRFLDYPVGPVDGSYGPVTRAAVRRYQSDHGLVIDGITGRQTWCSLQRTVC